MNRTVEDLIDGYMDEYGADADQAIAIMKAQLDAALAERQRQEAEGEQP